MAIRVPNLGLGDGKTGDTELKIRQDYNHNFSDQTNAASRLLGTAAEQVPLSSQVPSLLGTAATKNVGTAGGDVMEVGAYGFGGSSKRNYQNYMFDAPSDELKKTQMVSYGNLDSPSYPIGISWSATNRAYSIVGSPFLDTLYLITSSDIKSEPRSPDRLASIKYGTFLVLGFNASQDPNGFLKGASPIAEIYSDKMDLNQDATQQGGITFEKLGVGDYLVKGSLGFAQEGWYIETPKDANGNVLVAVVYEQLANNDISIKTYAKKFDDETGDIVPNLIRPRDIPIGRFISLRLHELPKEPPVMPTEPQPEV